MSALKRIREVFENRNLNELESKNLPLPSSMKGIAEGSKIIAKAIKSNQRLAIIGDYDVDGVSATCIVDLFFKKINFQNYSLKIPNRFNDDYGINKKMIDYMCADIYITLDNGISAFEVATHCKKQNKILIITDHHQPLMQNKKEILPKADVIINPHQKECSFMQKDICGAVVAWYLCAGIKKELGLDVDMREFSTFVSFAIISDMMPLVSLNRSLYKMGIKRIENPQFTSLKLLKKHFKEIDSQKIGFYITPILNSAGRLEDATIALDFLRENDEAKAQNLLDKLIAINDKRKIIQNEVFVSAKKKHIKRKKILVAYEKGWNEGVLGIVAAKLVEEFQITSFCFNLKDGILKGSGRAKSGVNLIATIQKCGDLLLGFGGHSGAVGLSLKYKNLKYFIKKFNKSIVAESSKCEDLAFEIDINEVDIELLQLLESYEPYGNGNKILTFESKAKIIDRKIVGKNHQALKLEHKNGSINAILFNNEKNLLGKEVCIQYLIQRDIYKNLQLNINKLQSI